MDVCEQRQHKEQTAEHILALCYPGNRLHVQRVNGKQCCHKRAPPERASHLLEHDKEQDHCNCMKKHIGKMMSTRL